MDKCNRDVARLRYFRIFRTANNYFSIVFNSYNRLAALARTRQSAPPLPSYSLVISMISSTDSSREGDIFRVQSFARILKLAATREKFIRNIVPTTFLTWLDVRLVVSKIN